MVHRFLTAESNCQLVLIPGIRFSWSPCLRTVTCTFTRLSTWVGSVRNSEDNGIDCETSVGQSMGLGLLGLSTWVLGLGVLTLYYLHTTITQIIQNLINQTSLIIIFIYIRMIVSIINLTKQPVNNWVQFKRRSMLMTRKIKIRGDEVSHTLYRWRRHRPRLNECEWRVGLVCNQHIRTFQ